MRKVVVFSNLLALSAVLGMQNNPIKGNDRLSRSLVAIENSSASDSYETWAPREWLTKIIDMQKNKESFDSSQNAEGQTILMCATKYSDCRIMQQVLNAKDAQGNRLADINARDIHGNTALSIAAELEDIEKMNLLLKNGADVELAKENISNRARKKLENLINEPFLNAVCWEITRR